MSNIEGSLIKIFPIAIYLVKKNKEVVFKEISKFDYLNTELNFNINNNLSENIKYFPDHVSTELGIIMYSPDSLVEVERKI